MSGWLTRHKVLADRLWRWWSCVVAAALVVPVVAGAVARGW